MVAAFPGVMKSAWSTPRRLMHRFRGHPVRRMGEFADGIPCQQRAGFAAVEVLHVDGGQPARYWVSPATIAVEAM